MDDGKNAEKNSFVMYSDQEASFELLNNEKKGELITAIFQYNKTRVVPALTGEVKMAFSFIKQTLDRDYVKWIETKRQRAIAGQKGGIESGKSRTV